MAEMTQAKYKELGFPSSKAYRNARGRMKQAKKRGNVCTLEDFKQPRKKFYKGKTRKELHLKRKFVVALATPKWIEFEDLNKIYMNCPKDLEVDHIIPLNHKLVSGLNVPWNFQYLDRKSNITKRNTFDGTYDNDSWRIFLSPEKSAVDI